MIKILYSIILAISLNIDSFFSGITYGLKEIEISLFCRIIISFITLMLSCLSFYGFMYIRNIFPSELSKISGAFILIIMGIGMIYNVIRGDKSKKNLNCYEQIDYDKSKSISIFESVVLTFVLSIDIMSVVLALSLSGFTTIWIPIFIPIVQFLTLGIGLGVGKKGKEILEKSMSNFVINVIPGLILFIIGIFRLF
ncbi:MAG: manganese efflux pump [Clostridia bacterium]|nr:manganese efflux pump [Clostridia bacterium]